MMALGIIPSWQFSANPSDNPMLEPSVDVPPPMMQAGVYYTQPAWGQQQQTLGLPSIEDRFTVGVPYGFVSGRPLPPIQEMQGLGFARTPMPTYKPIGVPYGLKSSRPLPPLNGSLGYVMVDEGPLGAVLGLFDSWAWEHRKGIAISALGVVGAAALFVASSVLR
jgi:hypothetical protein